MMLRTFTFGLIFGGNTNPDTNPFLGLKYMVGPVFHPPVPPMNTNGQSRKTHIKTFSLRHSPDFLRWLQGPVAIVAPPAAHWWR
jgi:hypothetical protein